MSWSPNFPVTAQTSATIFFRHLLQWLILEADGLNASCLQLPLHFFSCRLLHLRSPDNTACSSSARSFLDSDVSSKLASGEVNQSFTRLLACTPDSNSFSGLLTWLPTEATGDGSGGNIRRCNDKTEVRKKEESQKYAERLWHFAGVPCRHLELHRS